MIRNYLKVAYLAVFLLLFSQISFSQDNWTWLNPLPHGSNIVSADFFNGTNVVIGVGASGLVMRSTDNGSSWTQIPLNTSSNFYSISLINSSTGYIAGGSGAIYRTTNSGESWSQVNTNLSVDFLQIVFLSSSNGFLLTGGIERKVYSTSDGGVTWNLVVDYSFDRGEMTCIYSDSDQKVFFGTFNGGVYSAVSPGWSPSLLRTLTNIKIITGNGLNLIAISDYESVSYSSDGGTSWANGTGAVLSLFSPTGGKFISGSNAVIFSSNGRIARSGDAGASWIEVPNYSNGLGLLSVAYKSGNAAVIFGQYGLQYNSNDGGPTWSKTETTLTSAPLITSDSFDGNPIWAAGTGGTLIVSTDGGTSWTALNSGITDSIKSIKFVSDVTGFMVAKNVIYKTTDAGVTWNQNYSVANGIYLNSITAFDENNIAIAGTSKSVYISANGGTSWTAKSVGTGVNYAILAVPGTSTLFVAGNSDRIYKSNDKGVTWNAGSSASGIIYSIYFTSSSNGWAVGNSGKIYKTVNGGDTWTADLSNLTTSILKSVRFSGTDHGIIVGFGGTVLKTTNGGLNWSLASKLTESSLWGSTLFDNSTVLVFGANGTILKSYNAPLPVELNSFTAAHKNGIVTLNWETKTEIDNYGFEIERKSSATGWQKIGFVEGHFTTNSPKYYNFTDRPTGTGKIQYRLKQIDNDGSFEYSHIAEVFVGSMPNGYLLEQNYPNPFNPSTTIGFTTRTTGFVKLVVYNPLGESVKVLFSDIAEAGRYYKLEFDATGLTSGVYFYRLEAENFKTIKKLTLVK